ncbi:MAG: putative lipid II flippase FtsW [Parcubacteria group bacterium]|jgi:cell division protein FtsW
MFKKKSRVVHSKKQNKNKISRETLHFSGASDRMLFGIVGILTVFGVLMVASAGIVYADVRFGDPYFFFKRQLIGVVLGLVLLVVFSRIDYHFFRKWAHVIYLSAITLLVLILVPEFGITAYGASRWLNLGPIPSFQPSEMMKLALILYIAAWCSGKGAKVIEDFYTGLIPFLGIIGLPCVLVLMQPNVGTTSILVFIALAVFYLAGARSKHIFGVIGLGVAGIIILIIAAPYRMARFMSFINPEADPQGTGYQIQQALIAIGSGGWLGVGLGHSKQKGLYLPEPVGDSIFAIISEELGLIGALIVLIFFFLFAWRGMKIAANAPDVFGKLVAGGITVWITGQAIINIAAITSLMPLTGIPMPFISYGGTSIIFSLAAVGILLNISKQSKEKI